MKKSKQSAVVSIRLDEASLNAVDLLVNSGLESNRSRAISHFVNIGIQSSKDLLDKAQLLADNVYRLRSEMIEAVKTNNIAGVVELIDKDSSLVNASNGKGETAVLMAAYFRAHEVKEILLNRGAELSIFEAAAIGNAARVGELLDVSPELLGAYSADGYTPLGLASHFGSEETVKLLLERGANVNARSKDGNLNNMAIHASIAGNFEQVTKLLIENGANVNALCEGEWRRGFSPLHVAGYFGRESIIKMLLENSADKTAITASGQTPQELAEDRGHLESAALLR